jgi:hypothetical protein
MNVEEVDDVDLIHRIAIFVGLHPDRQLPTKIILLVGRLEMAMESFGFDSGPYPPLIIELRRSTKVEIPRCARIMVDR